MQLHVKFNLPCMYVGRKVITLKRKSCTPLLRPVWFNCAPLGGSNIWKKPAHVQEAVPHSLLTLLPQPYPQLIGYPNIAVF